MLPLCFREFRSLDHSAQRLNQCKMTFSYACLNTFWHTQLGKSDEGWQEH